MKNKVIIEESFSRPAKRLAKRYPSFPTDLLLLVDELESNALLGTSLGGNLRKVRLAIRSKAKEKAVEAALSLTSILRVIRFIC